MGAIDATRIYRAPGTLRRNPTAGSPPSGGTLLGTVSEVTLRIKRPDLQVPYEEYGGAIGEVIRGGWNITAMIRFRQWDDDAFKAIFGANIGKAGGFEIPDVVRAGRLGSSESSVLLYTPDDVLRPAILGFKCIPWFDETALEFMVRRELGIDVSFLLMQDSAASRRIVSVKPLASLVL